MTNALQRSVLNSAGYLASMYLNRTIFKDIGKMINLQVTPEEGVMRIEVLLKGESVPLRVTVGEYQCIKAEEEAQGGQLVLRRIETSREWINAMLRGFYPEGVSIPLGGPAFALVKGVL